MHFLSCICWQAGTQQDTRQHGILYNTVANAAQTIDLCHDESSLLRSPSKHSHPLSISFDIIIVIIAINITCLPFKAAAGLLLDHRKLLPQHLMPAPHTLNSHVRHKHQQQR